MTEKSVEEKQMISVFEEFRSIKEEKAEFKEKERYEPREFETRGLEPTISKLEEPRREEVLPEVEEQDFEDLDVKMRFAAEPVPIKISTTRYEYI